jgi:hypothetical protein
MSTRTRGMPRRTAPGLATPRLPLAAVAIGIAALVVVAAIAAIALTSGGGGASEPAPSIRVAGTALPALSADGADAAIGATLPTLTGTSPDGGSVVIGPTGTPQVIAVVAHWCNHCQTEVPKIVEWQRAGNSLPNGATWTTLSTSISAVQPNYPPSAWFEREGWTAPVLTDDAASSGLAALGITSFPGFVFVHSDGTVAGRMTGELEPAQIAAIAATLR